MTMMTLMTVVCGCFLSRGQLALTSTPLSPRAPRRDCSPIKLLAGHSGGRGSTSLPTRSTPTGGMRSPRSSPRRRSSRVLWRSTPRRRSAREARRAKLCSQNGLFGDAPPSGFIQKSSRIEGSVMVAQTNMFASELAASPSRRPCRWSGRRRFRSSHRPDPKPRTPRCPRQPASSLAPAGNGP